MLTRFLEHTDSQFNGISAWACCTFNNAFWPTTEKKLATGHKNTNRFNSLADVPLPPCVDWEEFNACSCFLLLDNSTKKKRTARRVMAKRRGKVWPAETKSAQRIVCRHWRWCVAFASKGNLTAMPKSASSRLKMCAWSSQERPLCDRSIKPTFSHKRNSFLFATVKNCFDNPRLWHHVPWNEFTEKPVNLSMRSYSPS